MGPQRESRYPEQGQHLRAWRQATGQSQAAAAAAVGVDQSVWHRWEAGLGAPMDVGCMIWLELQTGAPMEDWSEHPERRSLFAHLLRLRRGPEQRPDPALGPEQQPLRLRDWRQRAGLRQSDAARLCGVHRTAWVGWEGGTPPAGIELMIWLNVHAGAPLEAWARNPEHRALFAEVLRRRRQARRAEGGAK